MDPLRMGLQGHSYGGFVTNYVISHSSLFAAAAPASAVSNVISSYAEMGGSWMEARQGRMGVPLWKNPALYIENSTVFSGEKVSTPILLMHTMGDGGVPYLTQGLPWYDELHRLGKKAWLLGYEGEDHELDNMRNRLDYSIRLGQFFDYYLKGAPPPKWMTEGVIPGSKDDGLELDLSGKKP